MPPHQVQRPAVGWGHPGHMVSSALWPGLSLGWPELARDLDYLPHPSLDVYQALRFENIIFFWGPCPRGYSQATRQTGKLPFHT